MKERRSAGATHSFRLTIPAAKIVYNIRHPRRLGGKSRKVSDAIEYYFSSPRITMEEALDDIDHLEAKVAELTLKNGESDPPSRGGKGMFSWLRKFFH